MTKNTHKECFGSQAQQLLFEDPPHECVDCELFDRCNKASIASHLHIIADGFDLLVQNGIAKGDLRGFSELEKFFTNKDK